MKREGRCEREGGGREGGSRVEGGITTLIIESSGTLICGLHTCVGEWLVARVMETTKRT